MLKLINHRAVFISGTEQAVIPNVTFTPDQFNRFVAHMNKQYKNGWNYGNVLAEINHFKW